MIRTRRVEVEGNRDDSATRSTIKRGAGVSGRLTGRRAIVTGGANGLGAAIAELFAAEGAHVVIADLDRTADAAGALVDRIGPTAQFLPVDVRDVDATIAMVDRAAGLMGGVDAVVASAGVGAPPQANGSVRQLVDVDAAAWDLVMDVNARGVFVTCQRAAQVMIAAGHGGTLVTLASMASKRPTAGLYSISKAACWMVTRCLAHELGRYGIRVNAIGPGYVDTELFRSMVVAGAGDDADAQAAWTEARRSQIPLGRLGSTDDIAQCAMFLTSDESSYFSGSILHPDGGYTSAFGGG
jgi:NAD(P)-dependent dehydrogenase (short-subunit alcohol dehydrogenase family)